MDRYKRCSPAVPDNSDEFCGLKGMKGSIHRVPFEPEETTMPRGESDRL